MTDERDIWGRRFNHAKPAPMVTPSVIHAERMHDHKARHQTLEAQALAMVQHTSRIQRSIEKAKTPEQKTTRETLLRLHVARLHGVLDLLEHMGRGFDVIHEFKPRAPSYVPSRSIAKRRQSKALFDVAQRAKR